MGIYSSFEIEDTQVYTYNIHKLNELQITVFFPAIRINDYMRKKAQIILNKYFKIFIYITIIPGKIRVHKIVNL